MTRILSIALLSAITFGALGTSPVQASEAGDGSPIALQDLADRLDAHVDPGLLRVDELTRQAAVAAMLGASIVTHGDAMHAQIALSVLADDLDAGVPADIAVMDFLMENPEMEVGAQLLRVSGDGDPEQSWLDAFADVLDAAADLARAIDDLWNCC